MSALTESNDIRKVIETIVRDTVKEYTNPCFRAYRCVVVSPAASGKMGVRKVGDTTTLFLPYSSFVADAAPGALVWVGVLNNNWLNAFVWHGESFKDGGGGGSVITVDDALSSLSENPVQNKVIYSALQGKQNALTFDSAPTQGSNNPVTSGGVYNALNSQSTFNLIPPKAALTSYQMDTTGTGTVYSQHGQYAAAGDAQSAVNLTRISDVFSLQAGQYFFCANGISPTSQLVIGVMNTNSSALLVSTAGSSFTFTLSAQTSVALCATESSSGGGSYREYFTPVLYSAAAG